MSDMSTLECAAYLREAIKVNPELAKAMTQVIETFKCDDMYDWADKHPEQIKLIVSDLKMADEQFDIYDQRLADGDLS